MGKRNTRRLRMQSNAWMLQKSTILTYISETAPPQKRGFTEYWLNANRTVAGIGVFFVYSVGGYIYIFFTAVYQNVTQPQICW